MELERDSACGQHPNLAASIAMDRVVREPDGVRRPGTCPWELQHRRRLIRGREPATQCPRPKGLERLGKAQVHPRPQSGVTLQKCLLDATAIRGSFRRGS